MYSRNVQVLGPLLRLMRLAWLNYVGISLRRRRIGPKFFLLGPRRRTGLWLLQSSIWSSIKNIPPQVKANVTWLVGNGHLFRFWKNLRLPEPVADMMGNDSSIQPLLEYHVADFMKGKEVENFYFDTNFI